MKKIRVLSIFGTRPEAIKMAPLVKEIEKRDAFVGMVCLTGQHREMLDQVMDTFRITPDYDMNIMKPGQTLTSITSDVLLGLESVLDQAKPDIVLVHGDTTTSFAAALAAFYKQIAVGHVEAGLRTFDKYSPFPEEMNRNLTSKIATLHFAPTDMNIENLRREGVQAGVSKTGNTVIDALMQIVKDDFNFVSPELQRISFEGKRTILLTAHRRENLGKPFEQIFTAIKAVADAYADVQVIYPVHKNPAVRKVANSILGNHDSIKLIEPIDVADMHNLMNKCYMVMTDSGGIQEEAPSLGKPVLVLRTETERPEAVEMGTVKVVGVETTDIFNAACVLLDDATEYTRMSNAVNPYGDGHASEYICDAIASYFSNADKTQEVG